MRRFVLAIVAMSALTFVSATPASLDSDLTSTLHALGFTGRVGSSIEQRLGRKIDPQLAEVGRMLWFDTIGGLNNDNTCGGCHSPTNGFGDTQSIAIGIESNGIVGPGRVGPRNQRRTPMAINTAFYPRLMWNSRFQSLNGDPFSNARGFMFPQPEGMTLSHLDHLLQAQAFIPPTERVEVAGFKFPGNNYDIRAEVLRRLNEVPEYQRLFGGPITFDMIGRAIAEFEFTLVFADAPIDRYARGDLNAMTDSQKRGALLFFGKAGCVSCHAVSGQSNEMFSDFREHVAGVPQLMPSYSNVEFAGEKENEDYGLEEVTGNPASRYAFRTSPLRNVALQAAFFHDGAYTRLEDAIRHQLDVVAAARSYDPKTAGVQQDMWTPHPPIEPILERLDPLLATPVKLSDQEFADLVEFVKFGLLDERARPDQLRKLVPLSVPSGRPVMNFQFQERHRAVR